MLKKILCLGLISTSILAMNNLCYANDSNAENNETITITEDNTSISESDSEIMPKGIYKYRVNANNVNVRKSPSTSSASLGKMNAGDVVYSSSAPIVREGTTWLYVDCGYPLTGKSGYIAYMYLTLES
ncbi:MAG: hypothetical protein Q4D26_04350 [Clostridia bacterium]|nr:hypothetical protein [Clostridia bacterium]